MIKYVYFVIFFFLSVPVAFAADSLSCYEKSQIENVSKSKTNHLFVVIDQTTGLNNQLLGHVVDQVVKFINYGNTVTVIAFSAYSQGKYTYSIGSTHIDSLLDKKIRDDTAKNKLRRFDLCMETQLQNSKLIISNNLKTAITGINVGLGQSDIFFSLKEISNAVSKSNSSNKIVLLVSDMLENSTISSFYSNKTVRLINPEIELKNVQKNDGYGNFNGASIYVIGAGLLPEDGDLKGIYRDPKIMQSLKSFWLEYFKKSNGQLVDFGMPMLLTPIPN